MHAWFTKKLTEMTALAHYCQFQILEAHLILAQTAVNNIYDQPDDSDTDLKRMLSLLALQAESADQPEAAEHLRNALLALQDDAEDGANVISVDFQPSQSFPNRFGA